MAKKHIFAGIGILCFAVAGVLVIAIAYVLAIVWPSPDKTPQKQAVISQFQAENEPFETVRQYMDALDFSAYETTDADCRRVPYAAICKPDAHPEQDRYTCCVFADKQYESAIDEAQVNEALYELFEKQGYHYIIQTAEKNLRSVYFCMEGSRGVVYARYGDEPTDFYQDMQYQFGRIDDHWFYWEGKWRE